MKPGAGAKVDEISRLAYRIFLSDGSLFDTAGHNARIDGLTGSRDRLKIHLVLYELNQHERHIGIEIGCRQGRVLLDTAFSQLTARTGDKVCNAILRFYSFVKMIVSGEYDTHTILNEKRMESLTHLFVGPMKLTR